MIKVYKKFKLVNEDFVTISPDQAMVVKNGLIHWIGDVSRLPDGYKKIQSVSLKDQIVFPSFIECHTHTVFAGSRADEFEWRNQGLPYTEIASRGGGILSTVKKTRQASAKELLLKAQGHVNQFLKQGVSTLEVKSGYGLDLDTEVKILKVARSLKGPRIITTYLGAHAKPTEFETHKKYLDYILSDVLPVIKKKKLSQRVDIFIENKFFESKDGLVFLKKCQQLGFDVCIHANQLSNSGGVDVALKLNARSADHSIHVDRDQIKIWSQKNTVAVLLPIADLYMKCPYPPARELIDSGVSVALATDFNPGTCPSQDVMLVGLLARLKMGMSLPEVFKAYTHNAAKALGIDNKEGFLKKGYKANFIATSHDLSDFFYSAGSVPKHDLYLSGQRVKR